MRNLDAALKRRSSTSLRAVSDALRNPG